MFQKQQKVLPNHDIGITDESGKLDKYEEKSLLNKNFKYLSVWKRVKAKIVSQIRIKRMIIRSENALNLRKESFNTADLKKFFISSRKGDSEQTFQGSECRFSINPENFFRNLWDFYLSVWLIYSCIVTPVNLAFLETKPGDPLFVVDMIIDFSFLVDVIINFFTGFYDNEGAIHLGNKEIALNYLKSWFLLDLLASFPSGIIDIVLDDNSSYPRYDNIIRLVKLRNVGRLLKVTRAVKLFRYSKKDSLLSGIQNFFKVTYTVRRAITTILSIIISIHIFACFFYYTCVFSEFSYDCWIVRYGYEDKPLGDIYLTCIYYSFVTLATIGYGEITPSTILEKCVVFVWMCISTYFLSFVISSLSTSLSQYDMKRALMDQKLSLLDNFVDELGLDKFTKSKIENEIKLGIMRSTYSSSLKNEVIQDLSGNLKFKIATRMYSGILKSLKFFNNKDQIFVSTIFPLLEAHYFIENEVIYAENDYADYIYFIGQGVVHYIFGENNTTFRVLSPGEYFGDIEIVKHTRRMFSVISPHESFLLGMGMGMINKVKHDFSKIWNEITEEVNKKQRTLIRSLAEMKVLLQVNVQGQIGKIRSKDLKINIKEEIQMISLEFADRNPLSEIQEMLQIAVDEGQQIRKRYQKIEERIENWRRYKKFNDKFLAKF
jgi:CRP-like cAMP-binding protein